MMLLMANFLVIGTWNTKGEELEFVCQELARRHHNPIRWDLSATKGSGDRNTALLSVAVFLMPLGGWSGVGVRGGQYYGVELVEAFREQMLKYWDAESIIDVDLPLDDPRFARLASEHLFGLMQKKWKM